MASFLSEAVSAAPPAEWDVTCRYESARVLTTVTSHVKDLPSRQRIKLSPPGRLPSRLVSPSAVPWCHHGNHWFQIYKFIRQRPSNSPASRYKFVPYSLNCNFTYVQLVTGKWQKYIVLDQLKKLWSVPLILRLITVDAVNS